MIDVLNNLSPKRLYVGNSLPPASQFEDGDMFFDYSAAQLYGRSGGVWLLIGSSAIISGATNVGGGEGEVYENIVGGVLQLRTLTNGDGYVDIATSGDVITIDLDPATADLINQAVQNGINLGGGVPIFVDKQGTDLRFRTLISSDGSLSIIQSGDEVDLTVASGRFVTDAQNVGGGTGEIYRDKTGSILNLRTLEVVDGALDIFTDTDVVEFFGADGENVGGYAEVFKELNGTYLDFRTLRGSYGVDVLQHVDDIEIRGISTQLRNNGSFAPSYNYDTSNGRWWIHGNDSGHRFQWTQNLDASRTGTLVAVTFVWGGTNVEVDIIRLGVLVGSDVYWLVGHGGDTVSGLWGVEHSKRIFVSTFLPRAVDGFLSGTQTYVITGAGNATSLSAARLSCYCYQYNVY